MSNLDSLSTQFLTVGFFSCSHLLWKEASLMTTYKALIYECNRISIGIISLILSYLDVGQSYLVLH